MKKKKTFYLNDETVAILEKIRYERRMNFSQIIEEAIRNLATDEEKGLAADLTEYYSQTNDINKYLFIDSN